MLFQPIRARVIWNFVIMSYIPEREIDYVVFLVNTKISIENIYILDIIWLYLTGIFSPMYGSCLKTSMILVRREWMPSPLAMSLSLPTNYKWDQDTQLYNSQTKSRVTPSKIPDKWKLLEMSSYFLCHLYTFGDLCLWTGQKVQGWVGRSNSKC